MLGLTLNPVKIFYADDFCSHFGGIVTMLMMLNLVESFHQDPLCKNPKKVCFNYHQKTKKFDYTQCFNRKRYGTYYLQSSNTITAFNFIFQVIGYIVSQLYIILNNQ